MREEVYQEIFGPVDLEPVHAVMEHVFRDGDVLARYGGRLTPQERRDLERVIREGATLEWRGWFALEGDEAGEARGEMVLDRADLVLPLVSTSADPEEALAQIAAALRGPAARKGGSLKPLIED